MITAGSYGISVAAPTTAVLSSAVVTLTNTPAISGSISLGCTRAHRSVVTSYARRPGGTSYRYLLYVNGRLTHEGRVTPGPNGVVSARAEVPNGINSAVQLVLDDVPASTGSVTPHCGAAAGATHGTAPSHFLARGSQTAYLTSANSDGVVTRWDPCAGDITVKVNAARGGAGALADAINAIEALKAGTGLNFAYSGQTDFVPRSTNAGKQPAKIVIAWADRSQTDFLGTGTRVLGTGQWNFAESRTWGGASGRAIASGQVVLDADARLTPGFAQGVSRGLLLMHELGHVAGLNHTEDATQVMAAVLRPTSYASWGSGDITGLRLVGASKGCVAVR